MEAQGKNELSECTTMNREGWTMINWMEAEGENELSELI